MEYWRNRERRLNWSSTCRTSLNGALRTAPSDVRWMFKVTGKNDFDDYLLPENVVLSELLCILLGAAVPTGSISWDTPRL